MLKGWTLAGFLCWLLMYTHVIAQQNFNLTLVSNVNDYAEVGYSDIWGFVDRNGIEYAIIGTRQATVIYSLEDPRQPQEVALINGANSIWRDFKSFGEFIFITTDQGTDGLIIVDMREAPGNITWEFWKPTIDNNGVPTALAKCHNLYIDNNGYCFLSGCNVNSGGILVVDIRDPENPVLVGKGDARYSHDNFTRGDTVWSADILSGFFAAIDVSDKANPVTMSTQNTTSNFTHNCWLSDDGRYLFTTDERANASVDAYDVSDLSNIQFLDAFRPLDTEGSGVIPHNTHYFNGFLITSWYTDGLVITDANRPENMIEVGHYDTYAGFDGGFNGCWGAYPYLPSGLLLASDIQTGLYVFQPNYTKASYLEGTVTDAISNFGLEDVKIEIQNRQTNRTTSDFSGGYKTGISFGGTYDVSFLKEGYRTVTTSVDLVKGEVANLDIEMFPLQEVTIRGRTVSSETGASIPNASIVFISETSTISERSDRDGIFEFRIFLDRYNIQSAAWGYLNTTIDDVMADGNGELIIELSPGYQDDFFADLGWQSQTDSATAGLWVRGRPTMTVFGERISNPGVDVDSDIGEFCYVTGNRGGSASFDDVDNGNVFLISQPMKLAEYENPTLTFQYWFFNRGGTPPQDDLLSIWISNGVDTTLIDSISESSSEWRKSRDYALKDYISLEEDVQIIFETGDQAETGHLVEAGIDAFLIKETLQEDTTTTDTNDVFQADFDASIFPNPFLESFTLKIGTQGNFKVSIYNSLGQQIEQHQFNGNEMNLGQNWSAGVHWIKLADEKGRNRSLKILKSNWK